MKKLNKIFTVIISIAMILVLNVPAFAATESDIKNLNSDPIQYTVYNEKGEIVEEGLIPKNNKGRYAWSDSITLNNGWSTSFKKSGSEAFYVTKDTYMKFSYSLNRNATIKYNFYSDSTPSTIYPTIWKTGTFTSSSANIVKIADKTNYYYVGVTNASSDPIKISNVSFTF